jgi:Na+/H+ antiporter NhaD/arsenite permease-like protein
VLAFAKRHWLTLSAGILALAFLLSGRVSSAAAARAIDVDLLLVLFALLTAIEILRGSGYVDLAVARTLARFRSTRVLALALVMLSGALASLITNDVALFIVIPFTIVAGTFADFDVEDAVVLEIVACNLIGCLTPLGNPQNLFIFHRSGWPAAHFVGVMLPFVIWSLAGLLAALFLLGRSRPLRAIEVDLPPRNRKAAIAGSICFALVLLEIARMTNAWPAAIAALIAGVIFLRRRMFAIDYSIVPLFFFAFIVVEGLRSMNAYPRGANLYVASIALSQVISNVPATILLSPLAAGKWRELLYGVNAGGCGTIIASLANLLGWRIYVRGWNRDPRFFWRLTALNFAFLAWAAIGGVVILSRAGGEGSLARLLRGSLAPLGMTISAGSYRAPLEIRRPVSNSASLQHSPPPTRARIRAAPSARLPTSPNSD